MPISKMNRWTAVVDIKCLCFLCYLVVSGELLAAAQGVAKANSSLGHKKHSQDKHGDRLLAEQGDASDQAPGPDAMDLSVTGACAVDIVHHCAHILKATDLLKLRSEATLEQAAIGGQARETPADDAPVSKVQASSSKTSSSIGEQASRLRSQRTASEGAGAGAVAKGASGTRIEADAQTAAAARQSAEAGVKGAFSNTGTGTAKDSAEVDAATTSTKMQQQGSGIQGSTPRHSIQKTSSGLAGRHTGERQQDSLAVEGAAVKAADAAANSKSSVGGQDDPLSSLRGVDNVSDADVQGALQQAQLVQGKSSTSGTASGAGAGGAGHAGAEAASKDSDSSSGGKGYRSTSGSSKLSAADGKSGASAGAQAGAADTSISTVGKGDSAGKAADNNSPVVGAGLEGEKAAAAQGDEGADFMQEDQQAAMDGLAEADGDADVALKAGATSGGKGGKPSAAAASGSGADLGAGAGAGQAASAVDNAGAGGKEDTARRHGRLLLVSGHDHADASVHYEKAHGSKGSAVASAGGADAEVGAGSGSGRSSGSGSGSKATVTKSQRAKAPGDVRDFTHKEFNAKNAEQYDLDAVLKRMHMPMGQSAAQLSAQNAPLARCLRSVEHAAEQAINPHIPDLMDECKAQLRSFWIRRASDIRFDPPLLAACAHDASATCAFIDSSTHMFGCLKDNRAILQPICRAAVLQRQAAAAEDISLDPDLARECKNDRVRLCKHTSWGEGAARDCLVGRLLRGLTDELYSTLDLALVFDEELEAGAAEGGGLLSSTSAAGLSSGCQSALLSRLMQESEDIRLNYNLASACSLDKQMLCPAIKPGGPAVQACLEHYMASSELSDACREQLNHEILLRSLDARLDHAFVASCSNDVRALCDKGVHDALIGTADTAALGAGNAALECLRGSMDMVRSVQCRSVVFSRVAASYKDNRLDAALMTNCSTEVRLLCRSPINSLACLRDQLRGSGGEDTGVLSKECAGVVQGRLVQASLDLAFNPELMDACSAERDTFCDSSDLEGSRVLDCLVDNRNEADFGDKCHKALTGYLLHAVRDIRTMAGLRSDCATDIKTLCKGVVPGEGRVIACLRDARANITDELCRRQVLRLLGFVVEDHRMDYELMSACKPDVQQFCAGVVPGDGLVHDCLRRSRDHVSHECAAAEEKVEMMEHEDVRLNPKIQRECPLAISQFCGDVPAGKAAVIRCLQTSMVKPHFPAGCKAVMAQLTDRAQVKYSLNTRLIEACMMDVEDQCLDTVDELEAGADNTTLACLASNAQTLSDTCRSELTSVVHVALTRYRVGMPLTGVCDGDVMARCSVDKLSAPFLEKGYVLGCLARHATRLHPPCWALISTMDDAQYQHAAQLEDQHWQLHGKGGAPGSGKGGSVRVGGGAGGSEGELEERLLAKVAMQLRRELEPRMISHLHNEVRDKVSAATVNVTRNITMAVAIQAARHHAWLALQMRPMVQLMGLLLVAVIVLGAYVYSRQKEGTKPGGPRVVKDGRV